MLNETEQYEKIYLSIKGMHCAGCAVRIENELKKIKSV